MYGLAFISVCGIDSDVAFLGSYDIIVNGINAERNRCRAFGDGDCSRQDIVVVAASAEKFINRRCQVKLFAHAPIARAGQCESCISVCSSLIYIGVTC